MNNLLGTEIVSEDDDLNGILASAEFRVNGNGDQVVTMKYGRKQLVIVVSIGERFAITRVDTLDDKAALPNETTMLYSAAKVVMKQFADRCGFDFKYSLSTSDEKMNAWANSKGDELFHFSPVDDIQDGIRYHYSAVISPEVK